MEGRMDNSREMAAAVVGAVIGGIAAFLFFTQRGRSVCREIESTLEEFSAGAVSLRDAVQKAARVANEGWNLLNDTLGEDRKRPPRYPSGQRSPF